MNSPCGFDGNSDIYGLGVRLAIYLQRLTSVVAENLYEQAVESARGANTTFQIAMLAGLILITTSKPNEVRAIEAFIALLFCFSGACIASLQAYSATKSKRATASGLNEPATGSARTLGDLLLSAAICSYGVWFLFIGLDHLPRTDCTEMVFALVDLFGGFRTFLKVVFIISLLGSGFLISIRVVSLQRDLSALLDRWGQPVISSPRQAGPVCMVDLQALRFLGGIVAIAIFVVLPELTLSWNHIQGVYTCANFSQLFPLAIGVSNLARVVYQLLKSVLLGDTRISWSL